MTFLFSAPGYTGTAEKQLLKLVKGMNFLEYDLSADLHHILLVITGNVSLQFSSELRSFSSLIGVLQLWKQELLKFCLGVFNQYLLYESAGYGAIFKRQIWVNLGQERDILESRYNPVVLPGLGISGNWVSNAFIWNDSVSLLWDCIQKTLWYVLWPFHLELD